MRAAEFIIENFADGKIKGRSRPGRVSRAGASCKGSVTDLRARAKKYGGEKGRMYHWCANMKGGRKDENQLSEEQSNYTARNYTNVLNSKYEPYGIPIKITAHFVDRLADPRNVDPITTSEIADFFAKLLIKRKDFLKQLPDEISFQVTDIESDVTAVFKKINGVILAVTVMRGDLQRGSQRRIAI